MLAFAAIKITCTQNNTGVSEHTWKQVYTWSPSEWLSVEGGGGVTDRDRSGVLHGVLLPWATGWTESGVHSVFSAEFPPPNPAR